MKPIATQTNLSATDTWEDIVDDFLEIKYGLQTGDRSYLLDRLKARGIHHEELETSKTLCIDGCFIIINPAKVVRELWIYHTAKRQIQRHTL